jgi:hypothetical protein
MSKIKSEISYLALPVILGTTLGFGLNELVAKPFLRPILKELWAHHTIYPRFEKRLPDCDFEKIGQNAKDKNFHLVSKWPLQGHYPTCHRSLMGTEFYDEELVAKGEEVWEKVYTCTGNDPLISEIYYCNAMAYLEMMLLDLYK